MFPAVQAYNELLGYFFYGVSKTEYMSGQPGDVSNVIKTPQAKEMKEERSPSEINQEGELIVCDNVGRISCHLRKNRSAWSHLHLPHIQPDSRLLPWSTVAKSLNGKVRKFSSHFV